MATVYRSDPNKELSDLPRAPGAPTPATTDDAAGRALGSAAASLGIEGPGDRHPVRALDDRGLHGSGLRDAAIDIDLIAWDRGVAVLDPHLIARARRARSVLGDGRDAPRSIEPVRYLNLPFCSLGRGDERRDQAGGQEGNGGTRHDAAFARVRPKRTGRGGYGGTTRTVSNLSSVEASCVPNVVGLPSNLPRLERSRLRAWHRLLRCRPLCSRGAQQAAAVLARPDFSPFPSGSS